MVHIGQVESTTAQVVRVAVTRDEFTCRRFNAIVAREIDPLGMTEFVAHKVQVAFACRHPSWIGQIILCKAMPREMTGLSGTKVDMFVYISASINQNAVVLSPTSAWSCDSAYEMRTFRRGGGSPW